ncbi:MAG: hypothetical protein IPP40_13080 [bacterium]|nr:hypothetical protein [bacterium]
MTGNITRLTALALILFATLSTASAKRLLLPPPDGYKGVEIHGTKYVVGQVYVPEFADTTQLIQYGFRGFEAIGSTSTYKKVKAIWPLNVDLKGLPDWVVGLTYEKARSVEEMEQAYSSTKQPQNIDRLETLYNIYGDQFNNYGGLMYIAPRYAAPGDPNYRLNNYGSSSGGGSSRGSYRAGCPPTSYNEYGYRYRTNTPTLLTPSTIGSTPRNHFVRPNYRCR